MNLKITVKIIIAITFALPLLLSFNYADDDIIKVFNRINDEVLHHSKAYETLKQATSTIGHRLTGSKNGKKAEEFSYALLKKYGYEDVKYMPFSVEAWSRDTVSLEVVPMNSDNFVTLKAVSLAHSPIKANVKGEIIDCGNGLESDFEEIGEKVKGKIALMNIGIIPENPKIKNLHRSEKTALAIKNGAIGVIIANQVKGGVLLTGTASVNGSLIAIPAICISLEDGEKMREYLKTEKIIANIFMKNKSDVITARNIIATIKGSALPKEKILIGGHLDSWDLSTGTVDNGLGSFTVMEIARVFKSLNLKPKRTVEFVMFMGEEQGLLGSEAMVKKMIKDKTIKQVSYMINLDMATNSIGFNAGGRDEMVSFIKQIGEKIKKIDTIYKNKVDNAMTLHSDHQSFMLEGIPVGSPVSNANPLMFQCYHADCDDIRWADKKYMDNCARFTAMMLYALANADNLPGKRLSSDETRKLFIKQGLKKELQIGGDWKWMQ